MHAHLQGSLVKRARIRFLYKLAQLLARIEHAGFHGSLGDAGNLGDLPDRFAVVVNEVDHLAVLRRQLCRNLNCLKPVNR